MSKSEVPAAGRNRRAWVALVVAWAVGIWFVGWVEWSQWKTGEGRGLADWLNGINVDTAPYLVLLVLAVPLAFWRGRRRRPRSAESGWVAVWSGVLAVGVVSIATSAWVATRPVAVDGAVKRFGDLPPAYHDEYSYLLQSRTFLAKRVSFPSHPTVPRLFDQMHVLNDGRFASRYFPGVGAWMAPWVALGHPVWGHWLAGAIAAMGLFGMGRELGGTAVGLLAGLLTALAPGMALFSNLLLSHHPTMAGLAVFGFLFLRMMRTGCPGCGLGAGSGLALAMLCRPMTAAAIGLPFGAWLAWSWLRGKLRRRPGLLLAVAAPLVVGLVGLFCYNLALTGNGLTTPYQVYTDTYTPRHVYGFDNVLRGEAAIAAMDEPARDRVLENYDRWAENLDSARARQNVQSRLIESGKWSLGLVPLLMAAVVFLVGGAPGGQRRWWLPVAAIVSLHAAHVPYWYAGIMNWHYVFESGPLWCLMFAGVTVEAIRRFQAAGRPGLVLAWSGMIVAALVVSYTQFSPLWSPARIDTAVVDVGFSKAKYELFRERIESRVGSGPVLVLVDHDPADRHIDYVINDPTVESRILLGRYDPRRVPLSKVREAFPRRRLFVFEARTGRLQRVMR